MLLSPRKREEEAGGRAEEIFEELTAKDFPKQIKGINSQIQATVKTPTG